MNIKINIPEVVEIFKEIKEQPVLAEGLSVSPLTSLHMSSTAVPTGCNPP